jgi:MarR family transcriptional regulator, organic hydroperoxide resistance regulator
VKTSRNLSHRRLASTYDTPVAEHDGDDPVALSYQLAHAAYEFHARIEQQLHDPLEELGLTLALADALWQLDRARGALSRRELAERLGCDPSNVTFLIDRLQERRLVTRSPARGDRRATALTLTDTGEKVRGRLIATIAESPLFAGLTEAQLRQLASLLARCVRTS